MFHPNSIPHILVLVQIVGPNGTMMLLGTGSEPIYHPHYIHQLLLNRNWCFACVTSSHLPHPSPCLGILAFTPKTSKNYNRCSVPQRTIGPHSSSVLIAECDHFIVVWCSSVSMNAIDKGKSPIIPPRIFLSSCAHFWRRHGMGDGFQALVVGKDLYPTWYP